MVIDMMLILFRNMINSPSLLSFCFGRERGCGEKYSFIFFFSKVYTADIEIPPEVMDSYDNMLTRAGMLPEYKNVMSWRMNEV